MQNNESYLAFSKSSKEVLKTATLFKNININALITGPAGSGKSLLSKQMLNDSPILDAKNSNDINYMLDRIDSAIIENFDKITDYSKLDFSNKKIVAISKNPLQESIIDKFFGITIELTPLSKRKEDIMPIANKFLENAKEALISSTDIKLKEDELDLTLNCHSLKKSVFIQLIKNDISEDELLGFIGSYLEKKLNGINIYREHLYLYEKPLIETGLKKYHSQLKLADALGLNRNTLRKKINELEIKETE